MNINIIQDKVQKNNDTNAATDRAAFTGGVSDSNVCSGCGKHCPLKSPSCGKGAAIARERGIAVIDESSGFSGRSGHDGSGHKHESHKDRDGDGLREFRHKHDHRHSRRESYDFENCEDLDLLFRSCAHMLHHKERHKGSRDQILMHLMQNGPAAQKDIQEELRIQPGSVSELLSKLEKHGLIVREKSKEDKRAVIIHLTEKGQAAAADRMREQEDSPFDVLTVEEQNSLRGILRKLLSAVQ